VLDAQWPLWADEEIRSAGLVPRVPFRDETSPHTWVGLGPERLDLQFELSNGQGECSPAVYGPGLSDTVNPKELTLFPPSAPEVGFSGDTLWDSGAPTLPRGPFQEAFLEEGSSAIFDPTVPFGIGHLDANACVSAGTSMPGAPVFSVALPQVSHVSDT